MCMTRHTVLLHAETQLVPPKVYRPILAGEKRLVYVTQDLQSVTILRLQEM